jgi:hypothetical protein
VANTAPATGAVAFVAAVRYLSQVSPYWAVRWPIPPPSVKPATSVEPTTPPGVTRPWAWVAASKSSQVAPPSEIASRALRIDLDVPHQGEVDYQAVVDGAVPGGVVAAATHRDLEGVLLRERQRRSHVLRVDAAGDRRRAPVDQEVEAEAHPLVLAVGGRQHVTGERVAELGEACCHRL